MFSGESRLPDRTESDTDRSLAEYREAAERGAAEAQRELGPCYLKGVDVLQDAKEAVKWSRKAAEQGDASALNSIGVCYKEGIGVPHTCRKC